MKLPRHTYLWMYWTSTLAALATALFMVAFYAPTETTMGPVQKISYLHVPIAINTLVACMVVFIASIGYFWQRSSVWDDLASAAAQVAVLFCSIVLLTGMIWAHQAWNQWWIWSPLLTFSLMLWVLYVVYLVLHRSLVRPFRCEVVCAIYGVISFLDVPLVYLSVKLLPDRHPSDVRLTPEMLRTLLVWFVPTTMICVGLIFARYRLNRRARGLPPEPAKAQEVAHRLGGVHS